MSAKRERSDTVAFTIRLPRPVYEALREYTFWLRIPKSAVVGEALVAHLASQVQIGALAQASTELAEHLRATVENTKRERRPDRPR